jgi:hypothetical protein
VSEFTRYNIVRRITVGAGAGEKNLWLPVGQVTIWPAKPGKKASGKMRINIVGDVEFHVFEDDGSSNSEQRRTGTTRPLDPDDIPI